MKNWILKKTKVDYKKMAKVINVSENVACALANRNINTIRLAKQFIYADMKYLLDEKLIKDMEKAVNIVVDSIKNDEKIVIYGDYDVDGTTSTAILYKSIKAVGGDVSFYIPHRQEEGYGLNLNAVSYLHSENVNLIFTTDNGISSVEEVSLAKELGMKVVILDHHEPRFEEDENGDVFDVLPEADAIVDPKQRECTYEFKTLCAGGLAYKFAKCLFETMEESFDIENECIALAGIATICDIVDLVFENRIIAKNALDILGQTGNIGLDTLVSLASNDENDFNETFVGFRIGPMINATGRLEKGKLAVSLLVSEDVDEATEISNKLIELNEERKRLTKESADNILNDILNSELAEDKVIVYNASDMHESIAGIVAGRIKDHFFKPTIVITKVHDNEGMAKGSGRSILNYNLFNELCTVNHLFTKFGGHAMAAGFSLEEKNISALRRMLNQNCTLKGEDFIEKIFVEKIISLSEIDIEFVKELEILKPFGKENPTPLFCSRNVNITKVDIFGKNKNVLKIKIIDDSVGSPISAISFNKVDMFSEMITNKFGFEYWDDITKKNNFDFFIDIVYTLEINVYNDSEYVQLKIADMRFVK